MVQQAPLQYTSGDLRVRPDRGEIRNAQGDVERLTPINSRVLEVLLSRSGQLVARSELFKFVWTNQMVNDDVLTRSVSDIRAALRRLSGSDRHIETVPKRGYIWVADADIASAEWANGIEQDVRNGPNSARHSAPGTSWLLLWIRRGTGYAASLVGLAVISGWLVDVLVTDPPPVIGVLPVMSDPPNSDIADRVERSIVEFLLQQDEVEVLGVTAMSANIQDPIPALYSAYGARWIVEGQMIQLPSGIFLDVALIDARTGTIDGSPERIEIDEATLGTSLDGMLLELEAAIAMQMSR